MPVVLSLRFVISAPAVKRELHEFDAQCLRRAFTLKEGHFPDTYGITKHTSQKDPEKKRLKKEKKEKRLQMQHGHTHQEL